MIEDYYLTHLTDIVNLFDDWNYFNFQLHSQVYNVVCD